jgi:uncharacterized coiled-coil protein SlyX
MSELTDRMRKEIVQDNFVGLLDEAADRIEALEAALMAEWAARDDRIEALEAQIAEDTIRLKEDTDVMVEATARIEALEAALREIKDQYLEPNQSSAIAKAALAPEQDKP